MKEFRVIQVEGINKSTVVLGGMQAAFKQFPKGVLSSNIIPYLTSLVHSSIFPAPEIQCVHSSNMVRKCSHRAIMET